MSGLAHQTGEESGPPTLPPFGLADGVAGLTGAYAVMLALYHRDVASGGGQVIDLSLLEPLVGILGPGPSVYDQLGVVSGRHGNRSTQQRPAQRLPHQRRPVGGDLGQCHLGRGTGHATWSGRPDIAEQSWFPAAGERVKHADMIDAPVAEWIGARPMEEVSAAFQAAGAALAPVYDVEQLMNDPHVQDRDMITTIEDEDLGPLKMQNLIFRMGGTPGSIRHGGRRLGQDTDSRAGRAARASPATSSTSCARTGSCDGPQLPVRSWAQRQAAGPGVPRRRRRGDARPGGRGTAGGEGDGPRDGGRGAARTIRPGSGSTPPEPPGAKRISTRSADRAVGIRIPKVESAGDVEWVDRAGAGHSRSSARSRARAVCWRRRRSPRCQVFVSWRWVGSTCSAT